jgi:hypothetical protein
MIDKPRCALDYRLGAERSDAGSRRAAQTATCPACGIGFTHLKPAGSGKKGWRCVPIVVETTETSCMRGDDEVRFFHPECWDQQHPLPSRQPTPEAAE